ncbi:MAG TPA: ornithine--oxo-acid transaminase [Phycisphaerae bacterium]
MRHEPETTSDFAATHARIVQVEEFAAHNYHPLPVVLSSGQGVWVEDVAGRRYLDMLAGYSALNFGHSHPELVRVAQEQMQRLAFTSRAFHNDQLGSFCEALVRLFQRLIQAADGQPAARRPALQAVLPMNTGAEGVETAIKLARKWGYTRKGVLDGQAEIVVFANNFHGRTTTIVGFSTSPQARYGFGPFTPGFVAVPFGDADAVQRAISPRTVAVLVEPIQGEGGVVVPPDGFLRALRSICSEHDMLLIADEIQTGFGRTGAIFACEHEKVAPDVLVLGKALGGGLLPISAVVSSRDIMSVFAPGDHGSTFGGNPLACAVAIKAIELIETGDYAARAAELGPYMMQRLRAIGGEKIKEVRGRGLLIGVELHPSAGTAHEACHLLMNEGLLCKDTRETTIRFTPPLVITRQELDWALERIERVLA